MDQLFASQMFEGSWEYASPVYLCFVELEKAYDHVPRNVLWEVLLLHAIRSLFPQ